MNQDELDRLRRQVPAIAGQVLVSAEALLTLLDDSRLSIDQLRCSAELNALRETTRRFVDWRVAAAAATKITYR